jgi:IclR family acetate operon transcriptional repressor
MKQNAPTETASTHQSLARGLTILETMALNGGRAGLSEIARITGLHRSTTHHLMQTLVELGYLQQDPQTRGYELSTKLVKLSGRKWTPEQLGQVAKSVLLELSRQSGEGTSVAAFHRGAVRIVAKYEGNDAIRVVQDVGAERPVHATAVGKAILAWLPPASLNAVLDRVEFVRFTPRTIASRKALLADLTRIRATGFAIDDAEHHEDIRCIAAPVFADTGLVVAALCSVGPKSRMTHRKLKALRAPLASLAQELSKRLGWHPE